MEFTDKQIWQKNYYQRNKERLKKYQAEVYKNNGKPKRTKITVEMVQEMNKLYNSGLTYRQIGYQLEKSETCISNYVWKPRKRGCRLEI